MNKTIIHCKTTAPMFMAGADTSNPELRAASIKGCMRFIWRAIQRADDIKKLREVEGELFGNAYGGKETRASKIKIRIENKKINKDRLAMLPHRALEEYEGKDLKNNVLKQPGIKDGGTFDVVLSSFESKDNHTYYVRLFVVTSLLYGFGRRARKGFGTISITGLDGDGDTIDYSFSGLVSNLNNLVVDIGHKVKYSPDKDNINKIKGEGGEKVSYPYIEEITVIGEYGKKETSALINQIGLSVHDYKDKQQFLGTSSPRFASSVLLSTIPWDDNSYKCIITQLHNTNTTGNNKSRNEFYQTLARRV